MSLEPNALTIPDMRLHHVGVVVSNIEEKRAAYTLLGYTERTGVIHDPLQTAYVQFLRLPGSDFYLELVAPDGPDSKLTKATGRKQPLNHLCYAVTDVPRTCQLLLQNDWSLLSDPKPAVAFEGRLIAWVSSPDLMITELVERGLPGSL